MPKKVRVSAFITILLLAALIPSAAALSTGTQQPERERRVQTLPVASPSPIPESTATPPASSPTPQAPVFSGVRSSATTRTIPELQARIFEILRRQQLEPAMVGVKVSSLGTGRVLFESNANKLLRPASGMKLYTVAAALGSTFAGLSLRNFRVRSRQTRHRGSRSW